MTKAAFRKPAFSLRHGEVHVWISGLDRGGNEEARIIRLLSPEERARAERFHFEEHRRRFIVRRGILRTLLAAYLDCSPAVLRFEYNEQGKPRLSPAFRRAGIAFNLSHADDIALFAITLGQAIGVDIERVREIPEMENIIDRFFSPGERSYVRTAPEGMRQQAFFDCWTRKEAFIKAVGTGLSLPLASFSTAPASGRELSQVSDAAEMPFPYRWSVRTLRPSPDHAGAIAVRGSHADVQLFRGMPGRVH